MPSLHYFAAFSDSRCIEGCDHEHATVASAVACISTAGGYVIAVENGQNRELNTEEERQFQSAMFGIETSPRPSLSTGWVGWPNLLDPDEV